MAYKCVKQCTISSLIREMKIKTKASIILYPLHQQKLNYLTIPSVGENMELRIFSNSGGT
jgi:hypothetical protein